MNPQTHDFTPEFRAVARHLVALHQLMEGDRDDSPEGEAIRDAMDPLFRSMSRSEYECSRWLSEDLYSVSDPPPAQKPSTAKDRQRLAEALAARDRGEWDRALELLRECRDWLAPVLLASHRGLVWSRAGLPEVAAVFLDHAARLDPANAHHGVPDRGEARELAGQASAAPEA